MKSLKGSPTREKRCLRCGKPVYGRSDKKFCDEYCRSTYNNHVRSAANNLVRRINNALLKNRKILESMLSKEGSTTKVKEEELLALGFQPQYHTHTQKSKGQQYLFCYEYGYQLTAQGWYQLIKKTIRV